MTDLNEMIAFADSYGALGTAVQYQIYDLIDQKYDEINPCYVDMIEQYLGGKSGELDVIIAEYREYIEIKKKESKK